MKIAGVARRCMNLLLSNIWLLWRLGIC